MWLCLGTSYGQGLSESTQPTWYGSLWKCRENPEKPDKPLDSSVNCHCPHQNMAWPSFIFPYIGNNHHNWLMFFKGIQTTNQWLFEGCTAVSDTPMFAVSSTQPSRKHRWNASGCLPSLGFMKFNKLSVVYHHVVSWHHRLCWSSHNHFTMMSAS